MALVRTIDVFCDWPGCVEWIHGVVGHQPLVALARSRATKAGWSCGRREGGRLVDYCPAHR
jgi:hypothetical protein